MEKGAGINLQGKGDDEWCQGGQAGRDGLSEETSREPCALYVCSVTQSCLTL